MKTTYNLLALAFLLVLSSCNLNSKKITDVNDYNAYLELKPNAMLQSIQEDFNFWEKKLVKDPNQFPYLVKAAASQSVLFDETGNIDDLIGASHKLREANEKTNYTKSGYLRALARNYISQHKFKESLELLKKAEIIGENLKATQKMLFDVHLELGHDDVAETYLTLIEDFRDFDYLIRLSKWSDHKGDLETAISYLEQATVMAESSKYQDLIEWSYTNLADFYGHNGQISNAYNFYLKSLKLNPNNAYAKKGIAWIVYSYEHNPDEALRILEAISKQHNAPDYHLLKAEIYEFKGDLDSQENQLSLYKSAVKNALYGDMYNAYNVILYNNEKINLNDAETIAKTEINNRPTPQSYDLLAWTYYNKGDFKEALRIMEAHVVNKTFEPETLYHLAQVYKANGKIADAKNLKKELMESAFELGPLRIRKIKQI